MSIFINTYKSHAGQSLLPIPWSYRMIKKVLVRLGQSHSCQCPKDNTTHFSLASGGGTEALVGTDFPKAPRTPTCPLPSRKPPSLPSISVPLFCFQEQWCLSKKTSTYPTTTDIILEAQHKVKMQGPSSNIVMNFKMEPSRGPSKLWPYTTTLCPGHTTILPEVSCPIWIPEKRQSGSVGLFRQKTEFFFFSWWFKHWCENRCHFTFKMSGKIRFLESLIDQSAPRFFIIEIVTLGLYMPLILTKPLIRHNEISVLILHDF